MEIKKVYGIYFSPTHTTKKVVESIVKGTKKASESIDITLSWKNMKEYSLKNDDLLIFGAPVYGGRIPKLIRESLTKINGDNTPIILVGVYGNRAYEDFFVEAQDIFEKNGFRVVGAGAFLGEHSFTTKVAKGRPNFEDLLKAENFGREIILKIRNLEEIKNMDLPGNRPYKQDMVSRIIAPEPDENCKNCGACVKVCPTGAIGKNPKDIDPSRCILCHACVRVCKFNSRKVKGDAIKPAIDFLERNCSDYKEIQIYL